MQWFANLINAYFNNGTQKTYQEFIKLIKTTIYLQLNILLLRFSIDGAFPDSHALSHALSYYQRCKNLTWVLVRSWTIPLLFSPEDAASMFSKNIFKF